MSDALRNILPEMIAWLSLPVLFAVALLLIKLWFKNWLEKADFNYRAKSIMTRNEMEFFQRLRRANPDGYVFPQVAFSALLEPAVKHKRNWWMAFKYLAHKRVDYAIYNDRLQLLCIVELDDRTHNLKKDAQRDAAFASAGIVTLRWQASNKPDEAQIRVQLEQFKVI